jgi:CRISPR-associated protein (TIGR03984 family)
MAEGCMKVWRRMDRCSLATALDELAHLAPHDFDILAYGIGGGGCQLGKVIYRDSTLQMTWSPTTLGGPRHVYEVRLFSAKTELRWLAGPAHTGQDQATGQAWLLSEAALTVTSEWDIVDQGLVPLHGESGATHSQYLLWGQVAEAAQGWSRLHDFRIGSLWAPVAAPVGGRIAVHYREYVDAGDDNGNLQVVAERLTALAAL